MPKDTENSFSGFINSLKPNTVDFMLLEYPPQQYARKITIHVSKLDYSILFSLLVFPEFPGIYSFLWAPLHMPSSLTAIVAWTGISSISVILPFGLTDTQDKTVRISLVSLPFCYIYIYVYWLFLHNVKLIHSSSHIHLSLPCLVMQEKSSESNSDNAV